MSAEHKLEFIRDLLKSCFLPELKQDLDSLSIQSEHFANYRQALVHTLPLVYDFVQQHSHWIYASDCEVATREVHACLIVLLCEVTAPAAIYKLQSDENLLNNANELLHRHKPQLDDSVEQILFTHYQSKLHKDCWKRQLGAISSFMRYLEFRYNDSSASTTRRMSTQWLMFCLSVGLTVRECHEPVYKHMGTRIFQLILHHANTEDIQNLNVHSVIYDDVFKDVHNMDSVVTTADIWSCLYKCLDYYRDIDSFSWNYADDMLEILLRNISLTSDSLVSICLLKFITKLCAYFAFKRQEIEDKCNADLSTPGALNECRYTCAENTSYTSFRWAKSILIMFVVESHKLMLSPNICRQLLQELHRCYMVCILPIALPIIEPHLLIFFEKFTAVLMEVIVVQKREKDIVKFVRSLIETFLLQLQHCDESVQLAKFRIAFEKLLEHKLFLKNK